MPRTNDRTVCRDAAKEAVERIRMLISLLDTDDVTTTILVEADQVIRSSEGSNAHARPDARQVSTEKVALMTELRKKSFN